MRVLITGSARGLGAGLALRLGAAGHAIAVHYRSSRGPAEETAGAITEAGGTAALVSGDVSDSAQASSVVEQSVAALGGLDAVINNVGGFLLKDLADLTAADWDAQLATTVSATFYVSSAALPHLRGAGGGRIINLSDSSADKIVARPRSLPYSIGKTGILIMTRSMAVSEAPHGISVNAILPGVLENSDPLPDRDLIPAGRHGGFDDIGAAVDFLLSPQAGYVTGAFLHVGGGWNL
jgi:3-oxoacyl-[acyl-carrier protein] reductase